MRAGTRAAVFATLGFAAGIGATLGLQALYDAGGFFKNTLDHAFHPPHTATKTLFMVAAVCVFVALPIGIIEWVAEARFRRAERRLREARPGDDVRGYEGPEGRGLLFEGPAGRTLLLEGRAGTGGPRVVELPPAPPAETEPPAEPAPPAPPTG